MQIMYACSTLLHFANKRAFCLVDVRGFRVSSATHCAVNEVNHTFGPSPTSKLKKGEAITRNANNVRLSYVIAFRKQASLLFGGREGI